jgi:MSHA biogenesis protein MshO
MTRAKITLRQHGFTLIEAVVVIVVTAIVGAVVAIFIRVPVQGYVDAVARAQVTDMADTTLQKMKRDIRLALPNSLRVHAEGSTVYLEFLQTKIGGRYLADDDDGGSAPYLSWESGGGKAFTVVGNMPDQKQAIVAGDYLVVYNLGEGQEPANAYDCRTACNRASIATVAGNLVTLAANPFAGQTPRLASPTKRFQIVTSAVTYVCDPVQHTLMRYWNYDINPVQPATSALLMTQDPNKATAPGLAMLAEGLSACNLSYGSLANIRSALITLDLTFEVGSSGKVNLVQQVHMDNTP